jgi:tetraacyldisaccharide 4'-kinase
LIAINNILKKKEKFTIPVICVGNIYLGGTGNTPLCIEVAKIFKKSKKKVAIIRKFYKSHEDEFKLIESKNIKLFTDLSRATAIKKAELENFDIVILDDGFQDSSIEKKLNIICFNEKQLAGNEMTIPSGPLREPLASLKNSQIIVINGNVNQDFENKIKTISDKINIYYSEYTLSDFSQFIGQNLIVFAGIGNPTNFFDLLDKNNLKIIKKISFPDHYNYSIKELNNLVDYSIKNNLKIITTEKDYKRIEGYKLPEIQYLSVELKIKNKDKFEKEIIKCLS